MQLLGAAVLFSTGGAAIKAASLGGWQVASWRSGVAFLALLLLLPGARRGWTWRCGVVGLAYAGTMIFFVLANKLTTAAAAVLLQATAPLYLLILGPLVLKEPVRRRDLLLGAAVAVGMALLFVDLSPAGATAPRPALGNLLGVGAGLCWALTLLGLRWTARDGSGGAAAAAAMGNLVTFLVCLPLAGLPHGSPGDWGIVVYLGVVQVALAYKLLTTGIRGVSALEASLLILLEPVLNPVWAWLVHGEALGPWTVLGGVAIVGATAGRALWEARAARRARRRLRRPATGTEGPTGGAPG